MHRGDRADVSDGIALFRRILGDAFESLDADVQRFHSLQGNHGLHGRCSVRGADRRSGRLLAALLGFPRSAAPADFAFEVRSGIAREAWTRHFARRTLRSTLFEQPPGYLSERIGVIRLVFALHCRGGDLHMTLRDIHALGLRWPRRWLPEVWAKESGIDGQLHFDVGARLRTLGLLVAYRGHLDVHSAKPLA